MKLSIVAQASLGAVSASLATQAGYGFWLSLLWAALISMIAIAYSQFIIRERSGK